MVEMVVSQIIWLDLAQTTILLISASKVAKITGVNPLAHTNLFC
jgi:hypothetical protein